MSKKLEGVVTVRLPAETAEQLAELAKALDRTPAWIARQALIVYLKERDAAGG